MEQQYQWFLGIDWGGSHHQVCLKNDKGENVGSLSVEHCGEGLSRLICWLRATVASELATVAAALEVPHGVIVETLAAHGVNIFSINPKQLARFRDRHSVAGAKDDRRDARVLASSLRTDIAAFRQVGISNAFSVHLRELSHAREECEREHRRLSNQLRDLLLRYFPAMLLLSRAADEPWFWLLAPFTNNIIFAGETAISGSRFGRHHRRVRRPPPARDRDRRGHGLADSKEQLWFKP